MTPLLTTETRTSGTALINRCQTEACQRTEDTGLKDEWPEFAVEDGCFRSIDANQSNKNAREESTEELTNVEN
jgi:hypothetical protein